MSGFMGLIIGLCIGVCLGVILGEALSSTKIKVLENRVTHWQRMYEISISHGDGLPKGGA